MQLRTKRTAQKKTKFLAALAEYGTIYHAAKAAGVARSQVYHWQHQDLEFRQQVEEATEDNTEILEQSMFQRALDGDTTAGIFLLKSRRPERYRERQQIVHQASKTTDEFRVSGRPRAEVQSEIAGALRAIEAAMPNEAEPVTIDGQVSGRSNGRAQ